MAIVHRPKAPKPKKPAKPKTVTAHAPHKAAHKTANGHRKGKVIGH